MSPTEINFANAVKFFNDQNTIENPNYVLAIANFNTILESPNIPKRIGEGCLYFIGISHFKSKHYEEAIKIFEKLKKHVIYPNMKGDCYYFQGRSLFELNNYYEAINYLIEAFRNNTSHKSQTHYVIGQSWLKLEKYSEAIRYFDMSSRSINKKIRNGSLTNIGICFAFQKNYDTAKKYFEIVIQDYNNSSNSPIYILAKNNLAMTLAEQGSLDSALVTINEIFDTGVRSSNILDTKGYIHYKRKEYKPAKDLLESALSKENDNYVILYHLGSVYLKKNDNDKAIDYFDDSLYYSNNKFAEAYNNRAVARYNRKEKDGAVSDLRKSIELDPSFPEAYENLIIMTSSTGISSFMEYWKTSTLKKIFASILLSLLGLTVITTIVIPSIVGIYETKNDPKLLNSSKTSQEQTTNVSKTILNKSTNLLIKNTTNIVRTPFEKQKSFDVPTSVIIGMGLIVLILLAPIIRSAKVGPVELTIIDIPTTPTVNPSVR